MADEREGKSSSRIADRIELLLWIALMVVGTQVVLAVLDEAGGDAKKAVPPAPGDLIEAESLEEIDRNGKFHFWLQPTESFASGRWSRDGHMLALRAQRGDWIDLALPELAPGAYHLDVFLSRAPDYGIVTFELNRSLLGDPIDLWNLGEVVPSQSIALGEVRLVEGRNVLRMTVIETNSASSPPHYQFAIDGLRLVAVGGATDIGDLPSGNHALPGEQ